jgi:hypothetical protein
LNQALARVWLAAALAGCAGIGTPTYSDEANPFRIGLWPLWTADAQPWNGSLETRSLGPLLHWDERPTERRFEARPLLSSLHTPESARRDVLFPVAAWRADAQREESWLLLLGRARQDFENGTRERLFGAYFDGSTADGRSYRGLFPIAGRFLERFGVDRIDFALWPLFARASRGGYRETQILWPFFAYGRGDGRLKLRVWPLFGIDRRDGVYERRFWLWPFVHRKLEKLDSDAPKRSFYVFPLYGRRDMGPHAMRFYLLPLYARQWDRTRPEARTLDVLWPIFSTASDGAGSDSLFVRPFYARKRSPTSESKSWLLGLLARHLEKGDGFRNREWRVLWASRFGTRGDSGRTTRRADLWPFYRYARFVEPDGSEHGFLRVPYLVPMRGLDPDGWDRHYNQLFELYGARWQDSERRSSWLFGLREVRSRPGVEWTGRRELPVDLGGRARL